MQNLCHHQVYMIYPSAVFVIPPDSMNTFFQLQHACSISNKDFHQVQLLHRASLKSSWVMKYKTWVAPKNQFIFNVMIPPLNRVSHSSCHRTRLTRLQWSLHGHKINLQNVMHQSLKGTYDMPGWGTWPFHLWHWKFLGALLCCKHAARGLFYLHLTCRGQGFWSDLCDRSAFWLPQDPAWCLPPCCTYRQTWWLNPATTHCSLRQNLKHIAQSSWRVEPTETCSSVQESFSQWFGCCAMRTSRTEWWSEDKSWGQHWYRGYHREKEIVAWCCSCLQTVSNRRGMR